MNDKHYINLLRLPADDMLEYFFIIMVIMSVPPLEAPRLNKKAEEKPGINIAKISSRSLLSVSGACIGWMQSMAHNKTLAEAQSELRRTDAARGRYYRHFTGREWGSTKYYNLTLDSEKFETDGSVELIEEALQIWCKNQGKEYPFGTKA